MATRIVPVAEIDERLGSLDLANPVLRRRQAERHFLSFVDSLKIPEFKVPPVQWIDGTFDLQRRAGDLGITLDSSKRFETALHDRFRYISVRMGRASAFFESLTRAAGALSSGWLNWRRTEENESLLCAIEDGLGYYRVTPHAIILIPRPGIRQRQEGTRTVLHSLLGPAVRFQHDEVSNQYWIRGIRVPAFVVTNPEKITRAHIRHARTPALRRTLIDQYGLLRYSQERGFRLVDNDDRFGVALYVKGGTIGRYGGRTHRECVVELINSTPEPDGTHQHVARRVPGDMRTAHQAVAWTFGFTNPADYHPAVQT